MKTKNKPSGDKRGWEVSFDKFCEENELYLIGQDDEELVKGFIRSLVAKTKKDMVEEIKVNLMESWTNDGQPTYMKIIKKDWNKLKKRLLK